MVADINNHAIRVVGIDGAAVLVHDGFLWIADLNNHRISMLSLESVVKVARPLL